jgi:hypothetical protein
MSRHKSKKYVTEKRRGSGKERRGQGWNSQVYEQGADAGATSGRNQEGLLARLTG